MQSDIIFCRKVSVNSRKLKKSGEKGGVIFLPSPSTYPTPVVHISYLLWLPQKSSPYPIFLVASNQKVQPSFPTPFSLFLFSSLFALTRQPSLSHQNKISLSKEEIKGLTLKFQLQIVGGK